MPGPSDFHAACTHAFQPVVCLQSGRVRYYEALTRLRDRDQPIGDWIAQLERTGAIGWLDRHNVTAIANAAERAGVDIAVNVSAASVQDRDFIGHVSRTLAAMEAPSRLYFEITETAPITDISLALDFVETVQRFGSRVVIDDYGAGYTSPALISELRADSVKIDMAVIHGLRHPDRQKESQRIIREAVGVAQRVGAVVVAEGIDSPAFVARLHELGIEHGQGFYIAKPTLGLPKPHESFPLHDPASHWPGLAAV